MSLRDLVIDLSHWNVVTDVNEIIRAGVVGVIHKASEGEGVVDDEYEYRRAKNDARTFGLLFGAYHFLRPGDMERQAEHFIATAGEIDLYAADHEDEGVSLGDLKDFLHYVHKLTGKRAIIYSGHVLKNQMNANVRDEELSQYRLWLAQYTTGTPSWPTATWPEWWLWQHTDQGSLPGISGNVDLNYFDGTPAQLIVEWTGGVPMDIDEEEPVTITVTVPSGVKVVVKEE